MGRILKAAAVLAVAMGAAPALACSWYGPSSFGVTLGGAFVGVSVPPCRQPVYVAPMYVSRPVYVAPPPPVYVAPPPPVYVAPPTPVYVAPSPVYVAPPPPVYAAPPPAYAPPPPPMVAAPPPPQPALPPPAVAQASEKPASRQPAFLGVSYLFGVGGVTEGGHGDLDAVHTLGVEGRIRNWFALRSDLEFRENSRSWDIIGVKFWLPTRTFKPFVSTSVSVSSLYGSDEPTRWSMVASGGLDVWLGRHFFLEAQVSYRRVPDLCCGTEPRVTGSVGAGLAFF